jgi:hypothetical protein
MEEKSEPFEIRWQKKFGVRCNLPPLPYCSDTVETRAYFTGCDKLRTVGSEGRRIAIKFRSMLNFATSQRTRYKVRDLRATLNNTSILFSKRCQNRSQSQHVLRIVNHQQSLLTSFTPFYPGVFTQWSH